MKKVALGIIVVLVIAVLGLPPLLGSMTESRIRNGLATMDENPVMAATVTSYDRGWFASTARIDIGIDPEYLQTMIGLDGPDGDAAAAAMLADAAATFVVDVDHGPVVLRNGFFVGLARLVAGLSEDSPTISEIRTQFAMPYLIEICGRLGLTGAFSFDADVPPVDYADEDGEFFFSGATSEGTFRNGNLVSTGRIDEISFDTVGAAGQIRGISFEGDNEVINAYLWVGVFELLVESMVFTNPLIGAEPQLDISRLSLTGDTELDDTGELLSGSVAYAADSIVAGQELALTNAEIGVTLERISVEAINTYYEMLGSLDPDDPFGALEIVQALGTQLLERNPSIGLSPIRFEYMGEPFSANIDVRTVAGAAQGGIDLMNPAMLAMLFELSADATASKVLAQQIATLIFEGELAAAFAGQELPPDQDITEMAEQQAEVVLATFVGQGFLVDAGDSYTTSLEYAGGELAVNGTPLPLGMMFQ